jgi:hypothetical protein
MERAGLLIQSGIVEKETKVLLSCLQCFAESRAIVESMLSLIHFPEIFKLFQKVWRFLLA